MFDKFNNRSSPRRGHAGDAVTYSAVCGLHDNYYYHSLLLLLVVVVVAVAEVVVVVVIVALVSLVVLLLLLLSSLPSSRRGHAGHAGGHAGDAGGDVRRLGDSVLHSAKGGAVETGCSDLNSVIYVFTI